METCTQVKTVDMVEEVEMGTEIVKAETEDTLVEIGAIMGVKGTIPTPYAPNIEICSSADRRATTAEVV